MKRHDLKFSIRRLFGMTLLFFLAACGGRQGAFVSENQKQAALSPQQSSSAEQPESQPTRPSKMQTGAPSTEYANREIVPLLEPIPKPITDSQHLSEDPSAIRQEVARLMNNGNWRDALPLIDVLLILNPMDLEMLETRGRILVSQGYSEDGTLDLTRCCEKGRKSCCQ